MADILPIHQYITNDLFRQAIGLLDAGRVAALAAHLDQYPSLLSETASFSETFSISGTLPGQYFEAPKLLWFVAENPIRNRALPDNIIDIIQCIIDHQRKHSDNTLQHDLYTTLALVTSGNVSRETGMQGDLVNVLVKNGADPNCAEAALAHGEHHAVQALLDAGAEVNLLIAAGMGFIEDLERLLPDADADTRQKALSCAANCSQPTACRILIDNGVDPSQYNPQGFHAHCTPVHSAVETGSYETVTTLVSRGGDTTIKDRIHDSDALGWAQHLEYDSIIELIEFARRYMPIVEAVKARDIGMLGVLLDEHPDLVNATIGDNPRTLLHFATDGNVIIDDGEVVRLLIASGANVHARFSGPHEETPLHWAASIDHTRAIDALLDAGADIDAGGAVIGGGTALTDAVVFCRWNAAQRLVDRGAAYDVWHAAAMGDLDKVKIMFDVNGTLHEDSPRLPNTRDWGEKELINGAFWMACRRDLNTAQYLHLRGADINAVLYTGDAPLDVARIAGQTRIESWLLSLDAKSSSKLIKGDAL